MNNRLKTISGSVLSQYGIIIALIALALVPVFFLTGRYIVRYFESYSLQTQKNNETMNANTTSSTNASNSKTTSTTTTTTTTTTTQNKVGPLGGTLEKPIQNCSGSTCTIDYGDFTLTGIPANFGGFVQSSGTAGGTETLLTLLDQIANDPSLPAAESNLLKQLATSGHSLASDQKQVETMIKGVSASSYGSWVRDGYRNIENNNSFQDYFDRAMTMLNANSDPKSKNIRDIVNVLSSEVTKMNSDLVGQCTTINTIVSSLRTGSGSSLNLDSETYKALHPSASGRTDVDSAIICKTGNGTDNGVKCN